MSELKQVLARLEGLFLGTIEEVPGIGRLGIHAVVDGAFIAASSKAAGRVGNARVTPLYNILTAPDVGQVLIDLNFTDPSALTYFKPGRIMTIKKVIDMDKLRAGRTILLIQTGTSSLVLKCINCSVKKSGEAIITPTQDEALHFDDPALPKNLKNNFVQKYAHGRIFVEHGDTGMELECILMEYLCEDAIDYIVNLYAQQNNLMFYKYWADVIGVVHNMHMSGYVHGDCKLDNFMWRGAIGGQVLIIDPERMQKLADFPITEQNLFKLADIVYLVFSGVFPLLTGKDVFPIITGNNKEEFSATLNTLQSRLAAIYDMLDSTEKPLFLLNDAIAYDISIIMLSLYTTVKDSYDSLVANLKQLNPIQFERMGRVNIDLFLERLSNPRFLQATIEYLGLQFRRSGLPIEQVDLQFPGSVLYPLAPSGARAALPVIQPPNTIIKPYNPNPTPPAPKPVYSQSASGVSRLSPGNPLPPLITQGVQVMYNNYPVCYQTTNGQCLLFYDNGSQSLHFDASKPIQMFIFFNGRVVTANDNQHNLFYFKVQGAYFMVYMLVASTNQLQLFEQYDMTTRTPTQIRLS